MDALNAELINVVGFPIAVCIALFWVIRDMAKTKQEMMMQFRISIEQNTQALKTLINKLDKDR